MAKQKTEEKGTDGRNPLLPKISISKWKPDKKMMDSIDKTMTRASGGQEPDQWHKDYSNG